jgi:proteasome lid subunit RPN8/RPN11
VRIARAALEAVHTHAVEGYPYEICGMLVGGKGGTVVTRAVRATNDVQDRARDTYRINPQEHLRIEREVDDAGEQILGYYHSHPDHPARASVTDAERSWAGPVYVIVSCQQGRVVEGNAFVAENDGGPMRPVPMEVVG